jgi:hypothetical protein
MDTENEVNTQNEMIFHKIEWYPIIIRKVDRTEGYYVTRYKSDADRNIAFCLLCGH